MKSCSLFIPRLFSDTRVEELLSLASLETLLARADRVDLHEADAATRLFSLFGINVPTECDLPIAAVTRAGEGGPVDDRWWLRADPVYLQVEGTRLRLHGPELLHLTRVDADALLEEIQSIFAADGWHFEARQPDHWYVRPRNVPAIRTVPLGQALGCDIDQLLPYGPDAAAWRKTLNEVQMLLHASPTNRGRESRGELPVNSVWFWGGGVAPDVPRGSWAGVWSDESLALGLARLAGTPGAPLPRNGEGWVAEVPDEGEHLVVLGDPLLPAGGESDAFLRFVDGVWVAPLLKAMRHGRLERIAVYTDCGVGFRLTRRQLGRWWRRTRRLGAYR